MADANRSDLTLKNNDEWNVLHKAAKGGSKEIIERLLSLKRYIDSNNKSSSTPLMIAAEHGKFDSFFLLIDRGSNLALRNSKGLSMLDIAQQGGNESIMSFLFIAIIVTQAAIWVSCNNVC